MIKKLIYKFLDFEDEAPQERKKLWKAAGMKTLYSCKEGDHVNVVRVLAGKRTSKRLEELGLVPGTEITVISKPKFGPIKIIVKGTCLALGEKVASNIFMRR